MEDDELIGLPEADEQPINDTQVAGDVEGTLVSNDDEQTETETEDTGADSGGSDTEGDTAPSAPGDAVQVTPPPPVPIPTKQVTDPGEFTPKGDYAFDIELADGKKIHIASLDDVDTIPADADFGTPANLMKAQAKLAAMQSGIQAEQREYEAQKEVYEQQSAAEAEVTQYVEQSIAEINYLQSQGKLPPVPAQYENADWNDPEVAKDPAIQAVNELIDYRAALNAERAKYGLPRASMIEAATQRELDQRTGADKTAATKAAQTRKARGAMVGGANPGTAPSIPDDLIIGPGGNIRDIR